MPSTVGRYRIERVLGSGAFASVWLAIDEVLESEVAIKVLTAGLVDDLDVRNRFLEEAKILRRADSARLVRVHDIGELDDGRPYFVMSYADRGTLADRMSERRLPGTEALRLAVEIARGVEVINRLGVIHRDLKPSNVLFQSTTDGGERLLIADLGLAKALAHASGAFTLPVGTPGYMSPEQARFGAELDVRADVYGLGALTYHLVTGRAPGMPPVLVPPSAVRPGLPPAVDEVVMRALNMDRDRRWPTADAFGAALRAPLGQLAASGGGASGGVGTVRDAGPYLVQPARDETVALPTVHDPAPGAPQAAPVAASGTPEADRGKTADHPDTITPDHGTGAVSGARETMRDAREGRTAVVPPEPYYTRDRTGPRTPVAEDDRHHTLVDISIGAVSSAGAKPATSAGAGRTRSGGRGRLFVAAGIVAVLAFGAGGAYAVGKLTGRHTGHKAGDRLVTVTDTTGRLTLRVPPSWTPQPQENHWPVSVADRPKAPALRATPDYNRFVKDDVPVPGVFAGVTHDLAFPLPPARLGDHHTRCTMGPGEPYRRGSLSGTITPWQCGSITIDEVGLRDASHGFDMWVRVKLTGPPDLTRQILDSIRTRG